MTILQTLSQIETNENTLFDIEIRAFRLDYIYKGKEYSLYFNDLKDFYSIKIVGMNDGK